MPGKPPAKAKNNSAWITLAVLTVIGAFGFAVVGFIVSRPPTQPKPLFGEVGWNQRTKSIDQRTAENFAKTSVRAALKAPRSAEFGGQKIDHHDAEHNTWVVSGSVEAQNSFGVHLRQMYVVGMVIEGNSAQCVFIKLDGDIIYANTKKFNALIEDAMAAER